MQFLYIDESGSMTSEHSDGFPYFVICVLRVNNKEDLKRKIKIFVSKNLESLKAIDNSDKMFNDGKFKELKGTALSFTMKIKLANYLIKYCSDYFEVNIIRINNKHVNPQTYCNTARAFNYFIDLFMINKLHKDDFPFDDYCIQIDERNIKTNAQKTLEDYLAIDLSLKNQLISSVSVKYQDSCNNSLIQISDFFSNLYYSYLMHKNEYEELISNMRKSKMLNDDFVFPINDK